MAGAGGAPGAGGRREGSAAAQAAVAAPPAGETNCLGPDPARLTVERVDNPGRAPRPEDIVFGATFADRLLAVEWTAEGGWGAPALRRFEDLRIHPAAPGLHYGVSCFEGMKAFYGADGRGRLFRPDLNMARFQTSCERLQLPAFDEDGLLECIKALLRSERAFLPRGDGYSLYIRPWAMGTARNLGVKASNQAFMGVILSPVGPYFNEGLVPVKLLVNETVARAWPGGVGAHKLAGNYAPTMAIQTEAQQEHGCHQVLYTFDPQDGQGARIAEAGAMNVMVVLEKEGGGLELATPPLDGTILPGVSRRSVLELAKSWGDLDVRERPISVNELAQASRDGRLREIFTCGTAALVQPVEMLHRESNGEVITPRLSGVEPESLTSRVYKVLSDIQYYRVPYHGWSVPFE